jgi:hypothetical protein
MARKRRSHRRHSGGYVRRRRTGGGGSGGRFGVDITDAALSAIAGAVGGAIQSALTRLPTLPAAIAQAPVSAIGLYGLGVAFHRKDFRSVGAGLALGQWAGIGVAGAVAP